MKDHEQALTPPFIGRLALLGGLFLVILPHLFRMPLWLSAVGVAVFVWRLLHELRGYDLPGRLIRYTLVFVGIASVLLAYRTIIGQEAGVALLTMMLCLKLLELHTMRDAMVALFIGYFMVIGGFLFSQSIFMGVYLFAVVLALTAALIALNHPSGDVSHGRYYLITGGKLLLQALPLMVVMFILFPRLSGPLWSMPEDATTSKTGLSDSIKMGSISNLVQSEEVAFRVDFDGRIPPADTLYWRGPVLWYTDGQRWQRLRMRPSTNLPQVTSLGKSVGYTITLEPNNRRWIFTLDLPLALPTGLADPVLVRPDYQFLIARSVTHKIRYHLRSTTEYRLPNLPQRMHGLATQLPPGVNPRTVALARQWKIEEPDNGAIVQRALNYFSQQPFFYTRRPPLLHQNPVDEFLFNTQRGFCEHYATAFVTLMRAADIPARVVTGYQGGELNELGDYLIVRQSNAHAWAEVWLKDQGWVRVDPTAAVPPDRVETDNDATRFQTTVVNPGTGSDYPLLRKAFWKLRHGWDAINHSWNQWVLGFDREKQKELLQKLGLDSFSWQWLTGIMFGLLAAILAAIAGMTLLRRPRQRDPLARLYQQWCAKLAKAGTERHRDEGPRDFALRAVQERPELEASITQITRLYIRLRYTRHGGDQDMETLQRLVKGFRV